MSNHFTRLLRNGCAIGAALGLVAMLSGCEAGGLSSDRFGRTYYIDGAGNWGYGVAEVNEGLHRAGYKGTVINFRWSPTFNPALDQTVGRPVARLKGAELGEQITKYMAEYPNTQVNIICLSAGTGVGVWACENVKPPARVHNLVMLGSSLSSDYDMRKALANIDGHVYVYHSPSDMILQGPVRTLGTIDGKIGTDAAGLIGLRPRGYKTDRIVNIPWSRQYERYGWTGAHTDATCLPFVRTCLARHILEPPKTQEQEQEQPTQTGKRRNHEPNAHMASASGQP